MSWTHGTINGGTLNPTDTGDIHILGNIDGGGNTTLVSNSGSVMIAGKVDGSSVVNLTAEGDILIGTDASLGGGTERLAETATSLHKLGSTSPNGVSSLSRRPRAIAQRCHNGNPTAQVFIGSRRLRDGIPREITLSRGLKLAFCIWARPMPQGIPKEAEET